jgi:oxygen-independent coproporphyrinogen-3 oxidase
MYWTRQSYEAVGPGAHAFDGHVRRWNAARLDGYLAALAPPTGHEPHLPPGSGETLDATTAAAEAIVLGLRTDRGVAASFADAATGSPFAAALAWGAANGLVEPVEGGRIVLTTRGRLLSNELFARLL